jgi:hypothetical protein
MEHSPNQWDSIQITDRAHTRPNHIVVWDQVAILTLDAGEPRTSSPCLGRYCRHRLALSEHLPRLVEKVGPPGRSAWPKKDFFLNRRDSPSAPSRLPYFEYQSQYQFNVKSPAAPEQFRYECMRLIDEVWELNQ